MLKGGGPKAGIERRKNGVNKVLNVPIHMGSMTSALEEQVDDIKSIWVTARDDVMVNLYMVLTLCRLSNFNFDSNPNGIIFRK